MFSKYIWFWILVLMIGSGAVAQPAGTYSPNITADVNDGACTVNHCSLREAIIAANENPGADTINLSVATYTLTLGSTGEDSSAFGDLDITDSVTINGSGKFSTIISTAFPQQGDRVFHIDPSGAGITVNISGLTIQNANVTFFDGGGIYNRGNLSVIGVDLVNNRSVTGGGIFNRGSLTLSNSSVRNNVSGEGGGIQNDTTGSMTITNSTVSGNRVGTAGAGIRNKGTLSLTNSTISGNEAGTTGAAITNSGIANLNNVTIYNNIAGMEYSSSSLYTGGVYNLDSSTFNFQNTILAGNLDNSRPGVAANCLGILNSQDYNLIGQAECMLTGTTTHNIISGDPLLYPLGDNGGSTQTHLPRFNSSVIDAGNSATCGSSDQRNETRPVDGNSDDTVICDIGAVETVDDFPLVIANLNTNTPTADNQLVEGESVAEAVTQFIVVFDHPAYDPPGNNQDDDVTNPANYRLVSAGSNGTLNTSTCQAGVGGDDVVVLTNGVVYDSGTRTATISVNNGTPLLPSHYRFLVCSNVHRTTGITLDGNGDRVAGDDFVRTFSTDIPQAGTTWTVNSVIDTQDTLCGVTHCSLREAIVAANTVSNITIVVPVGVYNLTLTGTGEDQALRGDLDVLTNMTISGAGAANSIIRGSGDMVFDVRNNAVVTLSGLIIENGTAGVRIRTLAHVTVNNSQIQNNLGRGFIIQGSSSLAPWPRLTILGSTLTGNVGGISADYAQVNVSNTTITANDAGESSGGGIDHNGGNLILNNVTITDNYADIGGGVETDSGIVRNSIIYGNIGDRFGTNCSGNLVSAGNNLVGSSLPSHCAFRALASDLVDVNPLLGPLQDNGGPTFTRALLIGSPAISAGNSSIPGGPAESACSSVDQRGVARFEATCDIGAYQSQFAPYVTEVSSVMTPYAGELAEGGVTDLPVTQLLVTVSEPLYDPAGNTDAADVTNPANYRLVADGANNTFQTTICGAPQGDDINISIGNVSFVKNTRLITIDINMGNPLPVDGYRLIVCHFLKDANDNQLDGNQDATSGDDFLRNFNIIPAQAGPTYIVTTQADEVDGVCGVLHCSLREAVIAANAAAGANTIQLPPGTYALTRSGANEDASATGDLDILGGLTIQGEFGSEIDAKNLDRAIQILGAHTVTIKNIRIFNGNAGSSNGGAILNNAGGALRIEDSQIYSNRAENGGAIYNIANSTLTIIGSSLSNNVATTYYGGAIFNIATVNIDNSHFAGNTAGEGAALLSRGAAASSVITNSSFTHNVAVSNGGAIVNDLGAALTVRNSTISQNQAMRGAGIYHFSGTTNLNNVTITANTATEQGGGIYRNGQTVNISNSLLADNVDGTMSDPSPDCWGTLVSQDYNLIRSVSGCVITGTTAHNIIGQSPMIASLGSTAAGVTFIHQLLSGSPAIGSGNPAPVGSGVYACEPTDQWGTVRDDGTCDIGAHEEKLPISVYKVNSVPDTGDGQLVPDEIVGVAITQLQVKFNKPAQDPAGNNEPHDVTNPANYRLVLKGNDGTFQTNVCGPLQGDDGSIIINSVTYNNLSRIATLSLNGGVALPEQDYRFMVCGSTSIKDQRGNSLDGNNDGTPGDDFKLNFTVKPLQFGPVFQVTTTLDVNDNYCSVEHCSLREAIIAANTRPDSIVNLPAGTYNITIAGTGEDSALTGDFDIAVKMTVYGASWDTTIIDGNDLDRIFHVTSGNLTLQAVTVQGGKLEQFADGGGIRNDGFLALIDSLVQLNETNRGSGGAIYNSGNLSITNVAIGGNLANDGGGGGIANNGLLNIVDSTVSGNIASNGVVGGGGIYNEHGTATLTRVTLTSNFAIGGGAIENRSNGSILTVTNSTISGNEAIYDGGGIETSFGAITHLANVTITNNLADSDQDGTGQGGGLYNGFSNSQTNLLNTIVANNFDWGGEAPDCSGEPFNSQDHNLIGTLAGCTMSGVTDHNLTEVDPQLGVLQDNGGQTDTHALLASSPAVNTANNSQCPAIDQRSVVRPQGSICDMGAYEYTASPSFLPIAIEVGSFRDSGDGRLDENETTNVDITELSITFSRPMLDLSGNVNPYDVTNVANYRLIQAGLNGTVETQECGALQADDQIIQVNNVTYNPATYTATSYVHSGVPLPYGKFRLIGCDTLMDAFGEMLDGNKDGVSGSPYLHNFTISPGSSGVTLQVNAAGDVYDGVCDAAHCSLRDAIVAANNIPGSAVYLPPGTYTLSRTGKGEDGALTGDLDIRATMTIYGDNAETTIINANSIDRVIHTPIIGGLTPRSVTIRGLTIRGGSAPVGGGIYNESPQSTVTIYNSVVTNNTATGNVSSHFRSWGGGIANVGGMSVINSEVRSNTAVGSLGGGISNHQGVLTIESSTIRNNSSGISADRSTVAGGYGTLVIINSTISGNSVGGINIDKNQTTITNSTISGNNGYGIAEGNNADGWLKLNNVTITDNSGVGLLKEAPFADITMNNSLLYNNGTADCDANPTFSSLTFAQQDYNLIGTVGNRCEVSTSHNIIGVDPLIDPLGDNGGLTSTHALLAGSPAIDAGDIATCATTDQRGNPRPEGNSCDIGAYELRQELVDLSLEVVTPSGLVVTNTDITFTFIIDNLGAENAHDVMYTVTLPDGTTHISNVPSQGECDPQPNTMTCVLGTVASGESTTILMTVRYNVGGEMTHLVDLTTSGLDQNLSNNTATIITSVVTGDEANAAPSLNVYTSSEVTLTWGGVSWAVGYEVQITATGNFDEAFCCYESLDANVLSLTLTLPNGEYDWRIRAIGPNGAGSWSQPVEITIQTPTG